MEVEVPYSGGKVSYWLVTSSSAEFPTRLALAVMWVFGWTGGAVKSWSRFPQIFNALVLKTTECEIFLTVMAGSRIKYCRVSPRAPMPTKNQFWRRRSYSTLLLYQIIKMKLDEDGAIWNYSRLNQCTTSCKRVESRRGASLSSGKQNFIES